MVGIPTDCVDTLDGGTSGPDGLPVSLPTRHICKAHRLILAAKFGRFQDGIDILIPLFLVGDD